MESQLYTLTVLDLNNVRFMFSGSLLDILSLSNIEFPAASTLENVNYISTLAIEKASILPKEFLVSTEHKELTGFYQTSLVVQARFLTRKKTKGFFRFGTTR